MTFAASFNRQMRWFEWGYPWMGCKRGGVLCSANIITEWFWNIWRQNKTLAIVLEYLTTKQNSGNCSRIFDGKKTLAIILEYLTAKQNSDNCSGIFDGKTKLWQLFWNIWWQNQTRSGNCSGIFDGKTKLWQLFWNIWRQNKTLEIVLEYLEYVTAKQNSGNCCGIFDGKKKKINWQQWNRL